MNLRIKKKVDNLPDTPGVYFFKKNREILYVGKATFLRARVKSYFSSDLVKTRSAWIAKMMMEINGLDYRQTDSVLEALILEAQEIKKHQPTYNTREKDDKSYLYVVITSEDYPRLLTLRGRELSDFKFPTTHIFGPFPRGTELREAIKIIRKIFPFRDRCQPGSDRPCFNAQMGLCPGVCASVISQKDYQMIIRHLVLFFEGKKGRLVKELERQMREVAKRQEFEWAGSIKRQIFALQHIQDVSLIKNDYSEKVGGDNSFRIESYDIAHLSGKNTVGAMVVSEAGKFKKSDYRKFKLCGRSAEKVDDTANLREVLERRLKHSEWVLPNLIVVDGGRAQVNIIEKILADHGLKIAVVGVIKNKRHVASRLIGDKTQITKNRDLIIRLNQETHRFAIKYHRQLREILSPN